jgi:hypothetical protein
MGRTIQTGPVCFNAKAVSRWPTVQIRFGRVAERRLEGSRGFQSTVFAGKSTRRAATAESNGSSVIQTSLRDAACLLALFRELKAHGYNHLSLRESKAASQILICALPQ